MYSSGTLPVAETTPLLAENQHLHGRQKHVNARKLGLAGMLPEWCEFRLPSPMDKQFSITERKQAEEERQITIEFLRMANTCLTTRELIQETTRFFQKTSGCDAVGVRLREGEDFPYFETRGFSSEFVELERSLCVRDASGSIQRDAEGKACLACVCGQLLSFKGDGLSPGSCFWTGDAPEFASTLSDAERRALRGRCLSAGYRSIALFPLAVTGSAIGLLQLNSRKKNLFTPGQIALWQRLAGLLAITLSKFQADVELKASHDRLEKMVQERTEEVSHANAALLRANRALLALKMCDEALARASDETVLMQKICKIIVQNAGAVMAWVGFAEADVKKSVRLAASAGDDVASLMNVQITWADKPRGWGPTGSAIRTGKAVQCRDIASDPLCAPWRKVAKRYGYASCISLPLLWEGRCLGALSIYSAHVGGFQKEEVEMLERLASDLTFGIVSLRTRAAHEQLQRELLISSEREKQLISQELHDGLCQNLAGTAMMASMLHRRLVARDDPEAEYAKQITAMLSHNVHETRNLSHGLHPVGPEGEGLMNALSQLAETVSNLFHIRCFLRCTEPVLLENEVASTHLYRIAQEAINNARKHGEASRVLIGLENTSAGITLTIRDNGIGIPAGFPKKSGLGFRSMNYRAAEIGATLTVARGGKRGTLVTCIYKPGAARANGKKAGAL